MLSGMYRCCKNHSSILTEIDGPGFDLNIRNLNVESTTEWSGCNVLGNVSCVALASGVEDADGFHKSPTLAKGRCIVNEGRA
jgi:hypothetical protein